MAKRKKEIGGGCIDKASDFNTGESCYFLLSYINPNQDLSLTLAKWFLCLNLTTLVVNRKVFPVTLSSAQLVMGATILAEYSCIL